MIWCSGIARGKMMIVESNDLERVIMFEKKETRCHHWTDSSW